MNGNALKKITLQNLEKSSPQEVFDFISDHLLKQKKQSLKPGSVVCLYQNPDGLSCAIGCILTNKEANKFDDRVYPSWDCLTEENVVPTAHADLLIDLQSVHDRNKPEDWKKILANVADKHNLSFERFGNYDY